MSWLENLFDFNKNKCYLEHRDKYGICHGMTGGDASTGHLCYECINCQHWEVPCHIEPTPFMINNSKKRKIKARVKKIEKHLCEGTLPPLYGEEE